MWSTGSADGRVICFVRRMMQARALEQLFCIQYRGDASRLLSAHSRLIDQYLRRVWRNCLAGHDRAVAVGGYGRGELYPINPTRSADTC